MPDWLDRFRRPPDVPVQCMGRWGKRTRRTAGEQHHVAACAVFIRGGWCRREGAEVPLVRVDSREAVRASGSDSRRYSRVGEGPESVQPDSSSAARARDVHERWLSRSRTDTGAAPLGDHAPCSSSTRYACGDAVPTSDPRRSLRRPSPTETQEGVTLAARSRFPLHPKLHPQTPCRLRTSAMRPSRPAEHPRLDRE